MRFPKNHIFLFSIDFFYFRSEKLILKMTILSFYPFKIGDKHFMFSENFFKLEIFFIEKF